MSHFATLVLIDRKELDVKAAVERLLAPYDEDIEVPAYQRECWCVGRKAEIEAARAGHRAMGVADWDELRAAFNPQRLAILAKHGASLPITKKNADAFWAAHDRAEPEINAAWQTFLAPFEAAKAAALAADPRTGKPAPDCEECHGSGTHPTTYNPKSKWDWWQIGGRWTGHLSGGAYDPSADVNNIERCDLCQGTGTRPDMAVEDGCNGCDGKGTRLKWPTQWREYRGDIRPLADVPPDVSVHAVVTPDGEWHEAGRMGWFGIVSDERDDWAAAMAALRAAWPDAVAVVVDCHI